MPQYPFIDIHTHLFNGHYLPLDGILRSWHVPGVISRPLAHILTALVKSTDFSVPDTEDLSGSFSEALQNDDAALYEAVIKRLAKVLQKWSDRALLENSSQTEFTDLKESLESIVHEYEQDRLKEFSLDSFFDELFIKSLTVDQVEKDESFQTVNKALFWALQEMELEADAPYLHGHAEDEPSHAPVVVVPGNRDAFRTNWQILRFIGTLMDAERDIMKALRKDYSYKANGSWDYPEPDIVLNVMMDMEKSYSGFLLKDPKWDFKEQIVRMSALTAENAGKIVTFAAVDPHRRKWESYMDAAIARGITGFKFYPPMGFRPINIPDYKVPVDESKFKKIERPRPNSRRMEKRIEAILRKCHDHELELRLFAHCTPTGMEAFKWAGLNADPAYWDKAISTYQLDNLWLCLAHGGGTRPTDWHGWATESEEEWQKTFASRVVGLCREYKNVYCDLGYLLGIFDPDKRSVIFSRLKSELLDDGGNYPFHTKVMYGSDWHMKSMIGHAREYLNAYYGFFDDPDVSSFAEGFFSENAKRYLGLI